jgi:hypothetical protein
MRSRWLEQAAAERHNARLLEVVMKTPFFLYNILPEAWADWCCEDPHNLPMLFSGLAVIVAVIAHGWHFGWL